MTRDLVNNWFNKISDIEKDMPIIIDNGTAYTPRAILNEVNQGTDLGNRLQALLEAHRIGSTLAEEDALYKLRLSMSLQAKPQDKPIYVKIQGGAIIAFTPAQLAQEIVSGSKVGQQWIDNEKKFMQNILAVR